MRFNLIKGLIQFFRAVNIFSSNLATKGTVLTSATNIGDTTIFVENTVDFPISGAAFIDTNSFTFFNYTGKTANSFTGCTLVQAASTGTIVVPAGQAVVIDSNNNKLRVYGTLSGGLNNNIIAQIGAIDTDGIVGEFGTNDITPNSIIGVSGSSYRFYGVFGTSFIGYGLVGWVVNGLANGAPLYLVPSPLAGAPTHLAKSGSLWVDANRHLYFNNSAGDTGTSWTLII